jgi:hypothetical protein
VRIERALDCDHGVDRRLTMLLFEETLFALADAMLPRASSLHGESPRDKALEKALCSRNLSVVVHHQEDDTMEIAVADVADDWRNHMAFIDVALGFDDALS